MLHDYVSKGEVSMGTLKANVGRRRKQVKMADRDRERERGQAHQVQVHPQFRYEGGLKSHQHRGGPSATKIAAVMATVPVGLGLLGLSGVTLAATLIGLAIATPVFVICSPVLVPAALLIAFGTAAFITSGAFGLTGLTSLSWVFTYAWQATHSVPDQLDQAKRRMQDVAGYVGQKTKEVGQEIQRKAHDTK